MRGELRKLQRRPAALDYSLKKRGTQGVEASKAIDQKYLSGLLGVKHGLGHCCEGGSR